MIRFFKTSRKISEWALYIFCTILILWIMVSWMDVILHNRLPDPVYQPWNFFTMLI